MTGISAMATLTVRNAIRSKIIVILLLALVAVLIGLPLTLKSDGTLTGHVQVLLRYTPGLAFLILSIATIWASCAAVAKDIEDRQIQMILAKPVRAVEVWFGKWTGLCLMNAVLISVCALTTWITLSWHTRADRFSEEERKTLAETMLVAQRKVTPQPRDLQAAIQREFQESMERGEWHEDLPPETIRQQISHYIRARANSVTTGSSNRWTFDIPGQPPADRPIILRYRFTASLIDIEPIAGVWRAGEDNASHRFLENVEIDPNVWHTLKIPASVVNEQGKLTVEFANVHDRAVTILFNPETDMNLLVYEGGFTPNFLRAFLLLFFHLAFLAAIGVTAGSFFSVPVAALVSFYALLLLQAGRFIADVAQRNVGLSGGLDTSAWQVAFDFVLYTVYGALHRVIEPVYAVNPLELVAAGEWVAWSSILHMFLVKILLYSGLLAVLGGWHLAHREVALPTV